MSRTSVDGARPARADVDSSRRNFEWFSKPYEALDRCAKEFGETFTLTLGEFGPHVVFSNPAAIKEIFSLDSRTLSAGQGNAMLGNVMGPCSMFSLDGEPHLCQRRTLSAPLAKGEFPSFGHCIRDETLARVATWPTDRAITVLDELLAISLRTITLLIFGPEERRLVCTIRDLTQEFMALISIGASLRETDEAINAFDPRMRLRGLRGQFHEAIAAEIGARDPGRRGPQRTLLDVLIDATAAEGGGIRSRELADQVLTLLIAGHETTATATAWALYWLLRTPEALGLLLDELITAGDRADVECITALPYLGAVCHEALRICPVVPVLARVAVQPVRIQGVSLRPGTAIAAAIYLTHRRPDVYERPEDFVPDRFLRRRYAPHEFLPFGGGVRRCIGMHLALNQMKVMLATLLLSHSFRIAARRPIRPVRRSLTVGPSQGLPLVATPRGRR
jgi:cytochrome P450